MSKREPTYKGTNKEGNSYTSYNDGSYTYSNKNADTRKTSSTYYDTGKNNISASFIGSLSVWMPPF